MRRFLLLVALLVAIPRPLRAATAARLDGDLYVLGMAVNQAGGVPGGWAQRGPGGAWKDARTGVILKNRLFTTEKNGCLYATELPAGKRSQLGKADFGDTAFLFASGDRLYTVETNGNLFAINPADGSWSQRGEGGAWKNVRAGAMLDGRLYTLEADGHLYATSLTDGKRSLAGKTNLPGAAGLFVSGANLFATTRDGSLWRLNLKGGRTRLGAAGAWKAARAGAVLEGHYYTAETDGSLRAADLATGARVEIGSREFGATTGMFAGDGRLWSIEESGNLYEVNVRPGDGLNDFNCFPVEVEKLFREQGKSHYKNMHFRQVVGKQATLAGILGGLRWLQDNAKRQDLVVVYLTCHGGVDPEQGWGIGTADARHLWARDIKSALGKLPCQAILFLETCQSGGFAQTHAKDPPVPANVTALCACSGKQSTDNQLDIALAEALYGRADFNKDGVVAVDELIRYVELRYREWWPNGGKNTDGQRPVLLKGRGLPGGLPLTRVAPNLAAVTHNGTMWSALLEKQSGDRYEVHLLGWNSKPGPYFLTRAVTRDCICLPSEGKPLLVEQNGVWYPARLVKQDGDKSTVHYLGYNEEEVVTPNRIRYPFVGNPDSLARMAADDAGSWAQVGEAGAWKNILAGAVIDNQLYTAEKDGTLYATDLRTGRRQQRGSSDFGNTAFLFAVGDFLYSIEKDGFLYRIQPKDGSWVKVGTTGEWQNTRLGTVLGGQLYTIENTGTLYRTDPSNGKWVAVGKPEFGSSVFLFAARGRLFTIERDGSLYRVNRTDGSRTAVGQPGDWKGTLAGAVIDGTLCTAESNGCLYLTDLDRGGWRQIGKPVFGATRFAFVARGKLYTVENDGSLFRVRIK